MAISPQAFFEILQKNQIEFFTGVPDSLLKSICAFITDNVASHNHIIAANEGGAIALAMGAYFANQKIPLVYMQNSGLGNTINPLLSLADPAIYAIPMLLMIGWRGQPGVKDEPQHVKQGRVMLDMLKSMEIPYCVLSSDLNEMQNQLLNAIATAKKQSAPYALIIEKDLFVEYKLQKESANTAPLTREAAIECVIDQLDAQDLIVSTTGMASRELFELRKNKGQSGESDFLTIGGMGHASQIALGLALQNPKRRTVCLDGDGALLMHMGAMTIIGQQKPKQFIHIVLNNGAHDSVGGQPTVANDIDIPRIAIACGYNQAYCAQSKEQIVQYLNQIQNQNSLALLEIKTKKGNRKDLGRPTSTPAENKDKFMSFIQCA